jgi:hypothetical protein
MDQAGRVYLISTLDFEAEILPCTTFNISVTHPDYHLTTTVRINILPTNDNPPRITNRDTDVEIEENTPPETWSYQLMVEDRDVYDDGLTDNITIMMSLYQGPSQEFPFAVRYSDDDPNKPVIVNTKSFDYESGHRRYTLQIEAFDGHQKSQSFYLYIYITDINDVPPKFTQDVYSFATDEEVGDVTLAVRATDPESRTLFYHIELIDGIPVPFRIDSFGRITNNYRLNAELLPSVILFNVVATDSGGLEATARVEVSIVDINEFPPKFKNITHSITLLETTPPGYVVYQVAATDNDVGPIYGKVFYDLIPKSQEKVPFEIGKETGIIALSEALDYESVVNYDFLVIAKDGGGLGVTARVFVTVEDVNDVPPCPCEPEGTFNIEENQQVHVNIWRIDVCGGFNARDTSFTLETDYDGRFSVDKFGRVFLLEPLDHEQATQYIVNISLSGLFLECPHPATLTVNVHNVDEFLPQFEEDDYSFSIAESMAMGPIFSVRAFDGDVPDTIVSYTIIPVLPSLPFTVSANGTIFLTRNMDYDTSGLPNQYVFNVTATSSNNQITLVPTRVTVFINDMNDEPPVFPQESYEFIILEGNAVNSTLFTVRAFDSDKDPAHNTISYSILTSEVPFQILDPSVGQISSDEVLDYEEILNQPTDFVIQASDSVNTATASVTVVLQDKNEYVPEFTPSFLTFEIGLNITFGETVGRIVAHDRDGTGRISDYVIQPSSHIALPFQLDHTGLITAHFTGDTRLAPNYEFSVVAKDQDGYQSLPATVEVRFGGLDLGTIPSDHCLEVKENDPSPEPLLTLNDHYRGPEILRYEYTLKKTKAPFSLSGKNGRLFLEGPLDFEGESHIELDVSATNKFNLVRNVSVAICVLNVNDNPPRFNEPVASTTITKNAEPMTILEIPIVDDDIITGSGGVDSPLSHWCCVDPHRYLTGHNLTFTIATDTNEELFEAVYNSNTQVMELKSLIPARDINECHFELSVTAVDEDGKQSLVPLKVDVHVQRTLKFPPVFVGNISHRLSLDENEVMNIIRVTAQPNAALESCIAPNQFSMEYRIKSDSDVPFDVDGNGNIFNTRKLDYESDPTFYSFEVMATNTAGHSASLPVTVTLSDVNEFCPLFHDSTVAVSIPETTNPGTTLTNVMATDRDGSAVHNTITYTLKNGEIPSIVVSLSGRVSLGEELEYVPGGVNSYQFQIQASNDMGMGKVDLICGNSSVLTLIVTVLDANDKPPSFHQLLYVFELRENESASADHPLVLGQLEYSDPDTTGEKMVFQLLPSPTSVLKVDSLGYVYITQMQDFESEQNLTFRVTISDGENMAMSPAIIHIFVLNVNEYYPELDGPYQAFLSENLLSDASIAAFKAVDRDLGLFGRVTYSLDGPFSEFFRITRRGAVFNKRMFDYESDPHSYAVVVKATDGGGKMATHLLMINVTDENDNNPVFEQNLYSSNVTEMATREGKTFLKVKAFDSDISMKFRILNYSLFGEDSRLFSVNVTTGDISSVGHLDYEVDAHVYHFSVIAMDAGGLTGTASIAVTLLDSNDNRPFIVQDDEVTMATNFSLRIPEDLKKGSVIKTLKGIDEDKSDQFNKVVDYSILSRGEIPFSLSPNGELKIEREVTRYQNFSFVIVAIDNGGLRSQRVHLTVMVDPVNKAPPHFTVVRYNYSVREGEAPSHPITSLQAIDPDRDPISFKLVSGPEQFLFVDQSGHVHISQPFDFESSSHFQFKFEVNDGHFSSAELAILTIHVLPVNEFRPVIASEEQEHIIPETTPPGEYSFLLTAHDADQDAVTPGHGDVVSMVLITPTPYFDIHYHGNGSATVFNVRSFDYELGLSSFELRFLATDGGGLQSISPFLIRISIRDENDNKPIFSDDKYTFIVQENKAGLVGHVTAFDADLSEEFSTVTYKIAKGKSLNSTCPIDVSITSTGEIFLDTPLDYEGCPDVIELVIKACDSKISCTSTNVSIFPMDVNEFPPSFSSPLYSVDISEATAVGTEVLTVQATDKDRSLAYGMVTHYEGVGVPDSFEVTPRGMVKLVKEIDFETQPNSYKFEVLAFDGEGMEGAAVVMVTISNSNEFPPKFDPLLYEVTLSENSFPIILQDQAADVIAKLNVTDKDLQSDSLSFSILSTAALPFYVVPSGEVVLNGSLDFESTSTYEFSVSVREGNLTSSQPATVRVLVENTNDNLPYFTQSLFEYKLKENVHPMGPVLSVSAQDQDGRLNPLTYHAVGEIPDGIVLMEDGGVFVMGTFDYELLITPYLEFNVTAFDGLHSSVNSTKVIIKVLPENDLPPFFLKLVYNVQVEENIKREGYNLRIPVEDGDKWPEGVTGSNFTFTLAGSLLFAVKKGERGSEAVVYNTKQLDYEMDDHIYTLSLAVDDGNFPSLESIKIVISLTDVNDHSPQFRNSSYSFVVLENSRFIGRIEADDRDGTSEYSKVVYSIPAAEAGGDIFEVSANGTITAKRNLDYERFSRSYQFKVTATDGKGLTDVARVVVSVRDVNDNSPFFSDGIHHVSVAENHPTHSVVLKVESYDLDSSEEYKKVVYSIRSSREVPFVVNGNGEVSLTLELDYESSPNFYSFEIVATDIGGLEGSTSVEVTVSNIPDKSPCAERDEYTAGVDENTIPEEAIVSIPVPYNDGNGTLIFSVVDPEHLSSNVYVSRDGLVSVVSAFDYEMTQNVTFHVSITNGFLHCPQPVKVEIVVLDSNEYPPVLGRETYTASIDEGAAPGPLIQFSASDQDGGNYGTIVSFQLSDSIPFYVTQNGTLTSTKVFDAESDPNSFHFQVFAVDAGGMESKRSHVTVFVRDVNEHTPVFPKPRFTLALPESTPVGTTALVLEASDGDRDTERSDLRYSVVGDKVFFDIDSETGALKLIRLMDFESKKRVVMVTIKVQDQGGLSSQTVVKIRIRDVNEHSPNISAAAGDTPPKFSTTPLQNVVVYENTPPGTQIIALSLLVRDEDDSELFGTISFAELVGGGEKYFKIKTKRTSSNDTLIWTIVRKAVDLESGPSLIDLQYVVCDGGNLCSTLTVRVTVGDINEFPPKFSAHTYSITLPETTPTLSPPVFTPEVTDEDAGLAGQFTCSVEGSAMFAVHDNCSLYLTAPLSYCDRDNYRLHLVARDLDGDSPFSTSAVVMVTVAPVNRHPVSVILHASELTVGEGSALNVFENIEIEDEDCYGELSATVVLKDLDHKMTVKEGLQTKGFEGSEGVRIELKDQSHITVKSTTPEYLATYLKNAIYYNHDDEPLTRARVIVLNISDGEFFVIREIVVRIIAENDHLASFITDPAVPVWFKPTGNVSMVTVAPHLGFKDEDTGVATYKTLVSLIHHRRTSCDRKERSIDIMLGECGVHSVLSLLPNPTWGIPPIEHMRVVPFYGGEHLGYYFKSRGYLTNLYYDPLQLDKFSFVTWIQINTFGTIFTLRQASTLASTSVYLQLMMNQLVFHIMGSSVSWNLSFSKLKWVHVAITVNGQKVTLFVNGVQMVAKMLPTQPPSVLPPPLLITLGTSDLTQTLSKRVRFVGALSGTAVVTNDTISASQLLTLVSCAERMDIDDTYLQLFQPKDFNYSVDPFTGYLTFEVTTDAKNFEMLVKALVYRNSHTHPTPGRRFTRIYTWDGEQYLGHYGTVINVLHNHEYSVDINLPRPLISVAFTQVSKGIPLFENVTIDADEQTSVIEGLMVDISSNPCVATSNCSLVLDLMTARDRGLCVLYASSGKIVLTGLNAVSSYTELLHQVKLESLSSSTDRIDVQIAVSDFNSRHGDIKNLEVEIIFDRGIVHSLNKRSKDDVHQSDDVVAKQQDSNQSANIWTKWPTEGLSIVLCVGMLAVVVVAVSWVAYRKHTHTSV